MKISLEGWVGPGKDVTRGSPLPLSGAGEELRWPGTQLEFGVILGPGSSRALLGVPGIADQTWVYERNTYALERLTPLQC